MNGDASRSCAWCSGPIPDAARRDALTCSKSCRQARHRFRAAVGVAPAGGHDARPLRLAYADPPYPGMSRKYYGTHRDFAGEVDHEARGASLAATCDGWALSTSAAALPTVLGYCPPGVRVAAWFRGERVNVRARRPLSAWEPVIYFGGRLGVAEDRRDASRPPGQRVDALVYRAGVRRTDPARVIGAKPATFARWVFDLLGALPGDELVDVFPGSGGIARAWADYTRGTP